MRITKQDCCTGTPKIFVQEHQRFCLCKICCFCQFSNQRHFFEINFTKVIALPILSQKIIYNVSSLYGTSLSGKFTVTVLGNYYPRFYLRLEKFSDTVSARVLFTPYRTCYSRLSTFASDSADHDLFEGF